MARKQEESIIEPFFSVRPKYENSLTNFVHRANMMATAISTALSLDSQLPDGKRMNTALRESLQESLNGFDAAR